jgi:hypothetical protein
MREKKLILAVLNELNIFERFYLLNGKFVENIITI